MEDFYLSPCFSCYFTLPSYLGLYMNPKLKMYEDIKEGGILALQNQPGTACHAYLNKPMATLDFGKTGWLVVV